MSELNTVKDVLKVAIKKEEDAVEFYTQAADIVKESSTRVMLKEFASEEEKHVAILKIKEDLKDPINVVSLSIELSDICSDIMMDKDVRVLVFLNIEKLAFSLEKRAVEKCLVPT